MKTYLLFTLAICISCASAQDLPEIKGDRNPTTEVTNTGPITDIELGGEWKVQLIKGKYSSVEILTDSNLHDVILVDNRNGKLSLGLSKEIRSKRKLEVRVMVTDSLQSILVKNDAQLKTLTELSLNDVRVEAFDDAELEMELQADELMLTMHRSTKGEFKARADVFNIKLYQNANLKGEFRGKSMDFNMSDRTDATLKGNVDEIQLNLKDNAEWRGKDLQGENIRVTADDDVNVRTHAKDELILNLIEDSTCYVYGNPKITIEVFKGDATIKKE